MYACICRAITEAEVRRVGRAGVTAPEDLITLFGLRDPSVCGRCVRQPERLIALATSDGDCVDDDNGAMMPATAAVVAGMLQPAFQP